MAASGGEDFMSDEIVINNCCVCVKKRKRTEATEYCVDCKDYYCTSCVNIHIVVPSMEHHKLLDKSDFSSTRSVSGSLPSFPTQRCDEHKSEVLNMYCQDHDEVACATCIALNHRSCRNVCSILENIDTLCKQTEVKSVEQSIQLTRAQMEETRKSKKAHKQLLTESLDTAVVSVKTFKQELQALLDEIENDTIQELKNKFRRIEKSLKEDITIAEGQIEALSRMATQLQTMEGNKVQEFVCVKTFEKMTRKYEIEMNEQQRQPDETVSFAADQSIKSFLQELKIFGKVTCQIYHVPKTRTAVKPHPNSSITKLSKNTLYKVTNQREVDMKLPEDINDCFITGSYITDDGYLLLADNWNCKLKRLNLTTKPVTDFITLISPPLAVCQVSKTEAAVSLNNKTVQFVTLADKLTATRTLAFNHYCEGLVHNSGKLFITDSFNSVYIHDINGKELRKITTDASGKNIFEKTGHIAICADGGKVFVADWSKGLIILDIQGNYHSTISASEVEASNCNGVCTDGSNVFVCSYRSNNVVQIGQNHKLLGEIGIVLSPLSVCFDSQKRRLFSTNEYCSNSVSVLELV